MRTREYATSISAWGSRPHAPQVVQVYPSDANFILVKVRDGQAFRETARRANILVRTFEDPLLANCVRITVGRPDDNDLLLQAVSGAEQKRHA